MGGQLPPGHPPIAPGEPSPGPVVMPSGGGTGQLPPGHPPIEGGAASADGAAEMSPELSVLGYQLKGPEAWVRQPVRSQFRLAQFSLPSPAGDGRNGVCTVVVAGGNQTANVDRWRGQFEGKPEADVTRRTVAGIEVALVRIEGTMLEETRPMAGGPATARPKSMMLAAMIPVGDRAIFLKAWGPAATIGAHRKAFESFVGSLSKP